MSSSHEPLADIDPVSAGWDGALLESFLSWCEEAGTRQLLILDHGRVVAERYWGRSDHETRAEIYSMQKSVVGLAVGSLLAKGLLDLEAPASTWLDDGWTKATAEQEQQVRLRHLLTLTSGLYDDFSFEAPPDTVWYYNNNAYHQVRKIVERVTGLSSFEALHELIYEPIGMTNTEWRERPGVNDPTGWPISGMFSTARDMARFAMLALADGVWTDSTGRTVDVIGDQRYVVDSMRAATDLNPSYGRLWWVQDGRTAVVPDAEHGVGKGKSFGARVVNHPLAPSAPSGTVGAMGAADQRLFLVPSHQVAVIRLGQPVDRQTAAASSIDEAIWQRLAPALPSTAQSRGSAPDAVS